MEITPSSEGSQSVGFSSADIISLIGNLEANGITFWSQMFHSFADRLNKGYPLSAKQTDCLHKAVGQLGKAMAKKSKVNAVKKESIGSSRREVTFTVTSIKDYETGGYSWHYETKKAVGITSEGFKVYVTIPEAFHEACKVGSVVTMTATVTPKEDGFAVLTRPFNVKVA